MKNYEMSVQQAVDVLMRALREEGVLVGGPTLPKGLPYPDGDEIIDRHASKSKVSRYSCSYIMLRIPHSLMYVLLAVTTINRPPASARNWPSCPRLC
jgi:hypothetical protein